MRPRHVFFWIAFILLPGRPAAVPAGMASPLPQPEVLRALGTPNGGEEIDEAVLGEKR
jgi:hypothetical protein